MTLDIAAPNTSIRKRLILSAAIWISAAVIVAGACLVYSFKVHETNELKQSLKDIQNELFSLVDVDDTGTLFVIGHPAHPRTNKPLSGWYWQIFEENRTVAKSHSLWTYSLPPSDPARGGIETFYVQSGPQNQTLRVLSDSFVVSGSSKVISILVAGPASLIEGNVISYSYIVAGVLVLLALSLVAAVAIQISYGLRPIRDLRADLINVVEGQTKTLPTRAASEIQPLVTELNTLILRNSELVERARTQVGNLAHALKTPLSVIRLELSSSSAMSKDTINFQVNEMDRHIGKYLSHARAAGAKGVVGLRVPVADVVNAIMRALRPILESRRVRVDATSLDGILFQGDRADLEEILGNLIENAVKWAKSTIGISGRTSEKHFILCIDDDGPGISPEQRAEALDRGKRLDTTTPGSGLGLSIVRDLVEIYEGTLDLHRSDLGGLRVQLVLPAAPKSIRAG